MKDYYTKYIDYIKNTGGSPTISWFDEDWEPIGPMVRKNLEKMNLIKYEGDKIYLLEGSNGNT